MAEPTVLYMQFDAAAQKTDGNYLLGRFLICIPAAANMSAHLCMLLRQCHFHSFHLHVQHYLPLSVLMLSLAIVPAKISMDIMYKH